jgi:hypothetical protein
VKACAGAWKHNTREHTLLWRIDTLNQDNACVRPPLLLLQRPPLPL